MEKALKNIRTALGLSQQEMADKLGCSLRTYRGYEYETRGLPHEILFMLNKKFNADINWIITGSGSMFLYRNNNFEMRNDISVNEKVLKFGERLSKVQEKSGLADSDFAQIIGLDEEEYIDEFKNGDRKPNLKILNAVKQHFNVSIDWLLYGG